MTKKPHLVYRIPEMRCSKGSMSSLFNAYGLVNMLGLVIRANSVIQVESSKI